MTDLNNQEKLEEIYRLTVENHKLLRNIQARDRMALIFKTIYWIVIIGALGGVYLYIRPFYQAIQNSNERTQGVFKQFEQVRDQLPETQALQRLLQQLKDAATNSPSDTAASSSGTQ